MKILSIVMNTLSAKQGTLLEKMALNQSNILQLDTYVHIEMQFILSHNAPSHIAIQ